MTSVFLMTLAACGGGGDDAADPEQAASTPTTTTAPIRGVQNPSGGPTPVLHGSSGNSEMLARYVGNWVSGCLPYPMTQMVGTATVHRFELTSLDEDKQTFTGISHFRQYSDADCTRQVAEVTYQMAAVFKSTVMAPTGSSLPGYADIYELALTSGNGTLPPMSYVVGIYDDNQLRVGEGDRWFDLTKPSAIYTRQ